MKSHGNVAVSDVMSLCIHIPTYEWSKRKVVKVYPDEMEMPPSLNYEKPALFQRSMMNVLTSNVVLWNPYSIRCLSAIMCCSKLWRGWSDGGQSHESDRGEIMNLQSSSYWCQYMYNMSRQPHILIASRAKTKAKTEKKLFKNHQCMLYRDP